MNNPQSLLVISALTICSSLAGCDTPQEPAQALDTPKVTEQSSTASTDLNDVEVANKWADRAYQALAEKSTVNLDKVRADLSRSAFFKGVEFVSAVDLVSVETGEVYAHEIKMQKKGQDAGHAVVAIVDGEVKVHSHTDNGGTLVRDLLATLALEAQSEPSLNIEVYQYGDFDYLVQDLDSDQIASTNRFEAVKRETWGATKQRYATRGETRVLNPREWSSYGPGDHGGLPDPNEGKVDPCDKAEIDITYHVVGDRDTPLWNQFKTNHYGGWCSVGCGPVAFAMYLAWAQKEWKGVEVFNGPAYNQYPSNNNEAGSIVKSIGDHLNTFCIDGQGATAYYPRRRKFRQRMNRMLDDLNKGSYDLEGFVDYYSDKGKAVRDLKDELVKKDRPVILFGWGPDYDTGSGIIDTIAQQHIYLVDGYTEAHVTPSFCNGGGIGAPYRVNLGWGPGISKKTKQSVSRYWVGHYRLESRIKALGTIRRYKN